MAPKTIKNYTASFKLAVIKRAETIGNRGAGREYEVDERCIRRWRNNKKKIEKMPRFKRADRYGKTKYPQLEEKLEEWVNNEREKGLAISTVRIRLRAKLIAENMGITDFKAGPSWCYRFMKRRKLSIRTRTSIGQSLPEDWEEKRISFLDYVKQIISNKKLKDSHIINMDEVPLSFDCPPTRTVHKSGEKTITISTTGHEKSCFTCVLACTATGEKLKPFIIFKRKTIPKGNFPKEIVIHANEKGWMSENVMSHWLDVVYRTRKGAFFNPQALLVMDSMTAHTVDPIKKKCEKLGANIAIIPGGLTKKLQPLDLSINRSFKSEMRKRWEMWMSEDDHSYTATGKIRRASYETISQWIVDSWAAVRKTTIIKAFEESGIIDSPPNDSNDDDSEDEAADSADENIVGEDILRLFETDSEDSDFEGF